MALYNYSQVFWERIAEEERQRHEAYRQAQQFYDGAQPMPLRVRAGQTDDNVILNLYGYIVDKGVSFLFGKPPSIEVTEGTESDEEKYLETVWQRNHLPTLMQNVALNGAIFGHCFLEIVPRENDVPRLINLDPAIVRPYWSPDDVEQRLWYKIEYEALGADARPIIKKRLIEWDAERNNWQITKYEMRQGEAQYRLVEGPILWDYDFPPILDWQNLPVPNVFWGKRDIEQVAPQNGINFVASNIQRIIRFHGHPKTIGKGFNAEGVNVGPDEMFIIPSKDGDVKNLEMQSDLSATRAYFDMLVDLFLQLHHTPNMNPTKVSVGSLSGFALKILYGDLLALTNKKRNTYGDALAELSRRLLILAGLKPQTPKIHWASPLPENEQEATSVVVTQKDAGLISQETARAKLGYDDEVETERIQAETTNANTLGSQLLRAFNAGVGQ